MFKLEFSTSNAAFQDDGLPSFAVAQCLFEVADEVRAGRKRGSVFDGNGNTVGKWELSE